MSLLAVRGIPQKWNLSYTRTILSKAIGGPFEVLSFQTNRNNKFKTKVIYLRLSERMNPERIIEAIRLMSASKPVKLSAFIPLSVPDQPPPGRGKQGDLWNSDQQSTSKVLLTTHREIMTEIQTKYPALFNLNRKTGNQLLNNMGQTIMERLKKAAGVGHAAESPASLGRAYRKLHPHFGDFQLIESTLHALQDVAGAPRTALQEAQLLPPAPSEGNIPTNKVKGAWTKYSDKIVKQISEYVDGLDTEQSENDTEEDSARKRVREELKKIVPFFPVVVSHVLKEHFVPEKIHANKVRIFGEPNLPPRAALAPVLDKLGCGAASRSWRSYNALALRVPPARLTGLLALDGTVISGAKLVVRSADIPIYKCTSANLLEDGEELMEGPEVDWSEDL